MEDGGVLYPEKQKKKKKRKAKLWGSLKNLSKVASSHHHVKKEKKVKEKEGAEVRRREKKTSNRKSSQTRPLSSLSADGINPNLLMPPTIVLCDSSDSDDQEIHGMKRSRSEQRLPTSVGLDGYDSFDRKVRNQDLINDCKEFLILSSSPYLSPFKCCKLISDLFLVSTHSTYRLHSSNM